MPEQPTDNAPVREGDVLAKKYRVEKVLGVGGMGVVVAAMHLQLHQRVALKFLLPEAMKSAQVVERFAREARAAATIKSEHVARIIDVGELESGAPFMVMEFLDGEDLGAVISRGPIAPQDAVGYVLQACDAIAEAHAASIIHRDLKPANLFLAKQLDRTLLIKVLDFGISKAMDPVGSAALTSTQTLMGSPYYMSPEQLTAAKTVDVRSDIWSLGVILHELMAGNPPFTAASMPELVAAILTHAPVPLTDLRADIPPELAEVVLQCLQRDRDKRFLNVAALAAALAPFAPEHTRSIPNRISRVLGHPDTIRERAPSDASGLRRNTPRMTRVSGHDFSGPASIAGSMSDSGEPRNPKAAAPFQPTLQVVPTAAQVAAAKAANNRTLPLHTLEQSSWGRQTGSGAEALHSTPPLNSFPTKIVAGIVVGVIAIAGVFVGFRVISKSSGHAASVTTDTPSALAITPSASSTSSSLPSAHSVAAVDTAPTDSAQAVASTSAAASATNAGITTNAHPHPPATVGHPLPSATTTKPIATKPSITPTGASTGTPPEPKPNSGINIGTF